MIRITRFLKVDGITQKHVFITGCDSGFGRLLAIHLDNLGFPVFAACFTPDGQTFLSENASSRLTTLPLDVRNSQSIQEAFDFVKQKLGHDKGLWAVVNNAGVAGPPVPSEMCPLEEFNETISVNLIGPIAICLKFLPLVRKSKGRVVNMSSCAGRIAWGKSAYNTSKYGVEGFSDSLRAEVYNQGIKVSIIEPGYFLSELSVGEVLVDRLHHFYNNADEEVRIAYGKQVIDEYINLRDHLRSQNPDPTHVVRAYTDAIQSRFPRSRYAAGWDSYLFFVPMSFFPACVTDRVWRTVHVLLGHLIRAKRKYNVKG